MKFDIILIFDFGSQYCHLIGKRIRENNVYSEIVSCDTSPKEIENLKKKFNVKGIILSGGPQSVYEKNSPRINKGILKLPFPILGICYGHQLIAHYMGGEVKPARKEEYGISFIAINKAKGIFNGLNKKEKIWMSHGDTVFKVRDDFEVMARTSNCPAAAFRHKQKPR